MCRGAITGRPSALESLLGLIWTPLNSELWQVISTHLHSQSDWAEIWYLTSQKWHLKFLVVAALCRVYAMKLSCFGTNIKLSRKNPFSWKPLVHWHEKCWLLIGPNFLGFEVSDSKEGAGWIWPISSSCQMKCICTSSLLEKQKGGRRSNFSAVLEEIEILGGGK